MFRPWRFTGKEGLTMDKSHDAQCRNLLISLRRIVQAIELHSTRLTKEFGLTGPQLVILQEIASHDMISVSQLAKTVSLSQATVTDITKRLERKDLIARIKGREDKRRTDLSLSDKGRELLAAVPPLLQERFTDRFSRLENWEKLMIESAFDRVVRLMSAEDLDASPFMATGPLDGGKSQG